MGVEEWPSLESKVPALEPKSVGACGGRELGVDVIRLPRDVKTDRAV